MSGAPAADPRSRSAAARGLAAGLALLAAAAAASRAGLRPPPPLAADAPPGRFSAARALPRLRAVLGAAAEGGGEAPHPAGSAANARVRAALLAELRALGLAPEVQEAFACGRYRFCGRVSNVIARVPGRGPGPAVLVSAHHDSVPAGPGAADDGAGLAVALEAARALLAEPPARDVLLLLDDGEELGLAGAEAFLRHPLARAVGAVVNLEARGTAGPAVIFETSGPGAHLAARLADVPRPVASSAFAAVYRLLPNDTNLTSLSALGVPGANLALIEGAARYHTPRDDLAHLDAASVQHLGDTALALVRSLAAAPPPEGGGEATSFDVLGGVAVRFPERGAAALAAAAVALALAAAARDVRAGRTRPRGVALGALAAAAGVAAAAAAGWGAGRALGLDPILRPWVARPGPLVAAFLASGLAGAALAGAIGGRVAGPVGLRAGIRLVLAGGAAGLAAGLPGATHLLLLPALAAAAAGAAARGGPRAGPASDLAAALAGSVLWPVAWLLEPALGHGAGPAVAAVAALAALPLAPLAAGLAPGARLRLLGAGAASAAGLAAAAASLPPADASSPEHVAVTFHQDAEAGRARILASPDLGRLPPPCREAAPFGERPGLAFGWAPFRRSFEAPAAPLPLPGPELEVREAVREGNAVRVRAWLRSPRGAPEAQLALPPGVAVLDAAVGGAPAPRPPGRVARWFGDWTVLRHATLPPGGAEVELLLGGPGPFEVEVADVSPGLPPEAARVAAARPPDAVTVQEGDVTLVTRTLRLEVR